MKNLSYYQLGDGNEIALYVGTYKKYNNGDLTGMWVNMEAVKDADEFFEVCAAVHKDERDPEYMFQDYQNFPQWYYSESMGKEAIQKIIDFAHADEKEKARILCEDDEEETEEVKPAYTLIDYSEKAIALIGDTKPIATQLKALGGRFNPRLSCGAGWIFSRRKEAELKALINSGTVSTGTATPKNNEGQIFKTWLKEYAELTGQDVKGYVGAIKFAAGYYLIDLPSMNTHFWFHDEGPNYEYYKEVTKTSESETAYFKADNLSYFDSRIEHIEKGDRYSGDSRVWIENCYKEGSHRVSVNFNTVWGDDDNKTLCTDEERQLIRKGLLFARGLMERRLDNYIKRYGNKTLRFDTYWADR